MKNGIKKHGLVAACLLMVAIFGMGSVGCSYDYGIDADEKENVAIGEESNKRIKGQSDEDVLKKKKKKKKKKKTETEKILVDEKNENEAEKLTEQNEANNESSEDAEEAAICEEKMEEDVIQQADAPAVSIAEKAAGDILEIDQLPDNKQDFFLCSNIEYGDAVFQRINGKSYRDNDNVKLSDLRYLKMLHYNFDHKVQVGEMIVNAEVSEDVLAVFRELFDAEYEIQSMYLIDNYWVGDGNASDTESIEHNNTSAFCYRVVTGGGSLSNHAYGKAIDINPQQNPYVVKKNGAWHWSHKNADSYIDRSGDDPHMIHEGDVCCTIFKKYGFRWGGNWNNPIDYQHFEKK